MHLLSKRLLQVIARSNDDQPGGAREKPSIEKQGIPDREGRKPLASQSSIKHRKPPRGKRIERGKRRKRIPKLGRKKRVIPRRGRKRGKGLSVKQKEGTSVISFAGKSSSLRWGTMQQARRKGMTKKGLKALSATSI